MCGCDRKTGFSCLIHRERELRLRLATTDMLIVLRMVAEHFKDTDAPLGELARAAIAKAEGR